MGDRRIKNGFLTQLKKTASETARKQADGTVKSAL